MPYKGGPVLAAEVEEVEDVCVLDIILIFPPIYIQHNQCQCRRLLLIETSSVVRDYETNTHYSKCSTQIQQGDLAMP